MFRILINFNFTLCLILFMLSINNMMMSFLHFERFWEKNFPRYMYIISLGLSLVNVKNLLLMS